MYNDSPAPSHQFSCFPTLLFSFFNSSPPTLPPPFANNYLPPTTPNFEHRSQQYKKKRKKNFFCDSPAFNSRLVNQPIQSTNSLEPFRHSGHTTLLNLVDTDSRWHHLTIMAMMKQNNLNYHSSNHGEGATHQVDVLASCYIVNPSASLKGLHYCTTSLTGESRCLVKG